MAVNLNFGINGYVAVKDMNDRELYRQVVQSEQEADQWIEANKSSIQGWDFLKSSIIPVRIDNWEDLAKDLFLPTFVNHALKVDNLFRKVLASIVAIGWDILTFPVRLIALPFRLRDASSAPHVPVEDLIKTSPYFEEAKKNGVVRLVIHVINTQVTETLGRRFPDIIDQRKDLPFRAEQKSHDASCEVYLKALPRGQREYLSGGGYWKFYQHSFTDKGWNLYQQMDGPLQEGEPTPLNF